MFPLTRSMLGQSVACVHMYNSNQNILNQIKYFNYRWRVLLYDKRRQALDKDVLSSAHYCTSLRWCADGRRGMSKCFWNVQHFHPYRPPTWLQCANNVQKLQKPRCKIAHLLIILITIDSNFISTSIFICLSLYVICIMISLFPNSLIEMNILNVHSTSACM